MSNQPLKQYIRQFFLKISESQHSEASTNFRMSKIKQLLLNNTIASEDAESYIPGQFHSSIDGFDHLKKMITKLIEIEQRKANTYESKLQYESDNNILKNYGTAIGIFSKQDFFIENYCYIHQLKDIIKASKEDVKSYQSLRTQGDDKLVENIISELRTCFTAYNKSMMQEGILYSLSQLFWFYFQINQYQQCNFLLRTTPTLNDQLTKAKKAYQVTFWYYLGRMQLFDSDFKKAEENLSKAFNTCHSRFLKHKVQILRLLIPAKLICGTLPTTELISQYQMYEYVEIIEAIKMGDLKKFNDNMQKNQRIWIKRGQYFVMDKLQQILIRNLCKLVKKLNENKTIIEVEMFQKAINYTSAYKYDLLEIECLIGNLIYQGMIRAFVFPDEKKVVFSKDNAFPPLSTVFSKA